MHVTPTSILLFRWMLLLPFFYPTHIVLRQLCNYCFEISTKNMFSSTSSLFHYMSSFVF
jgi:hypothetical protein